MTSTTDAVEAVVEAAVAVDQAAASLEAQAFGYESTYVVFIGAYHAARAAGADQKTIAARITAEAEANGSAVVSGSTAAINVVDALSDFYALPGDLPTIAGRTYVYRPDASSSVVRLAEDEESIHSLVKRIAQVGDKREALKAQGVSYGKAVAVGAIKAAKDKAEAIDNLKAILRSFDKAVKEHKAKDKAPATAERYLKAATGPLSKVVGCLDDGSFDDAEAVRALANAILSEINTVLSHKKLTV